MCTILIYIIKCGIILVNFFCGLSAFILAAAGFLYKHFGVYVFRTEILVEYIEVFVYKVYIIIDFLIGAFVTVFNINLLFKKPCLTFAAES